jgi:HEPN domain-containing protein
MSGKAQQSRRIASFMALASEEPTAAGALLNALPRQASYFQHQAGEKLLRAVLEAEGVPAGPTHNIRTLTDLLPQTHELRPDFLRFDDLSAASTRYRYPTASGALASVSADETAKRQAAIETLCSVVVAFLERDARSEKE